jgi:hypothetical protein
MGLEDRITHCKDQSMVCYYMLTSSVIVQEEMQLVLILPDASKHI